MTFEDISHIYLGYENRKIDTNYFGEYEDAGFMTKSLEPYWNYVLSKLMDLSESSIICKGALKSFKSAFISFLYNAWAPLYLKEINEKFKERNREEIIWNGELCKYLLEEYPIFAKQLEVVCNLEINRIREVLYDIEETIPKKFDFYFPNEKLSKINEIKAVGSDRHNGGKSVFIINFEDGKKLVYKPHNMKIDRAFINFSNFIAEGIGIKDFYPFKSVDSKYGAFCEFIEHKELNSIDDAKIFYHKFGVLIAIIYLLRGNDMHAENIIASGDTPLIVDMETTVTIPFFKYFDFKNDKEYYDFNTPLFFPYVHNAFGFHYFGFDSVTADKKTNANFPIYKGERVDYIKYIDVLFDGINKTLKFVCNNKGMIKKKIDELFIDVDIRILIRATMQYAVLLKGLGNAKYLKDQDAYDKCMNIILNDNDIIAKEMKNYVHDVEEMAIKRLDVPYFSYKLTCDDIGKMKKRIDGICENDFIVNEDMVRWELLKYRNNSDECNIAEFKSIDIDKIDKLECIAHDLVDVIDHKKKAIVLAEENNTYMILLSTEMTSGYLGGNLGILIALSSFKMINNDNKCVNETIDKLLKRLTNKAEYNASLSTMNIGILNGTAGFLIGCQMLYEMKILNIDNYKMIISNIGKLSENIAKIEIAREDLLYGIYGMLVAIDRMDKGLITDKLLKIKEAILDIAKKSSKYNNYEYNDFYKEIKDELISKGKDDISVAYKNNNLLYGNAGRLYNYIQEKNIIKVDKKVDRMINYMLRINHILENTKPFNNGVEIGFLDGMSGVVYSICRAINPLKVPKFI